MLENFSAKLEKKKNKTIKIYSKEKEEKVQIRFQPTMLNNIECLGEISSKRQAVKELWFPMKKKKKTEKNPPPPFFFF